MLLRRSLRIKNQVSRNIQYQSYVTSKEELRAMYVSYCMPYREENRIAVREIFRYQRMKNNNFGFIKEDVIHIQHLENEIIKLRSVIYNNRRMLMKLEKEWILVLRLVEEHAFISPKVFRWIVFP